MNSFFFWSKMYRLLARLSGFNQFRVRKLYKINILTLSRNNLEKCTLHIIIQKIKTKKKKLMPI